MGWFRLSKISKNNYKEIQEAGFLGSYDEYVERFSSGAGGLVHYNSSDPDFTIEVCIDCQSPSKYLCDYPVGEGKTCDRHMCHSCVNETGEDMHYCKTHYREWEKFMRNNGVDVLFPLKPRA